MLLAHIDTVYVKPVKHICKSCNVNIIMSPKCIGCDNRCGVYVLVKANNTAPVKPWLLFTCNEEIEGTRAEAFVADYKKGQLHKELNELKLLVEIDRKNSKDAVYYDCDNLELEMYITSKGFIAAYGSFGDCSEVRCCGSQFVIGLLQHSHILQVYQPQTDK